MSDELEDIAPFRQLWSDPNGIVIAHKAVTDIKVFSGLIRNGRAPDATFLERNIRHGAQSEPEYWEAALPVLQSAFAASAPTEEERAAFARIEKAIRLGLYGEDLHS